MFEVLKKVDKNELDIYFLYIKQMLKDYFLIYKNFKLPVCVGINV